MTKPITLWAAIVRSDEEEWINAATIGFSKKQSRERYLEYFYPKDHQKALKNVRFARVTVTEVKPANG